MKQYLISLFIILSLNAFSQQPYNKVKYYFGDSINYTRSFRSMQKLDSTLYLTVTSSNDSVYYSTILLKTDLNGDTIKSVNFGIDSIAIVNYQGNSLIIDNDSNLVLVANKWHYNNNNYWDGYIISACKKTHKHH